VQVPVQQQLPELPNGCEVTSLSMLLAAGEVRVNKDVLADAQDTNLTPPVYAKGSRDFYRITRWGNPNVAFVGNVRKMGYGIYHAPLARLAETEAPGRVRDLTGGGFTEVMDQVRSGSPVLVWTTVTERSVTRWVTWRTPQGLFRATKMEHAVLVVGYTARGLIVNDPLAGRRKTVPAKPFIRSWQQLGRQALMLTPNQERETPLRGGRIGLSYFDLKRS